MKEFEVFTRKFLQCLELKKVGRSWLGFAFLASASLLLFFATATAVNSQTPSPDTAKQEKFVIPDVVVLDQDGNKYNFYTDLVKNKKVILNFVYTSCNGICPSTGKNFTNLRLALGDRVGKDVHMITVTTDPETDTPEKLKAWSAKFKPDPNWKLITGSVDNLTRVLQVFTGDGVSTGYHVPAICVVDDKKNTQEWNYGLAPVEELMRMIDAKPTVLK